MPTFKLRLSTLALSTAAVIAVPAHAANVTVTPANMQGWMLTDYRGTTPGYVTTSPSTSATIAAIDTAHPPAGESGSVHMATTDSTGKADFTLGTTQTGLTFGNLTGLSYDYYRSSSSTTTNFLAPAIRIIYDADGNLATTADTGYMIFEPVYNELAGPNGNMASPTDAWVHEDVIGAKFWQRQFSPGQNTNDASGALITQTLSSWKMAGSVGNGDQLSNASLVLGINFGVGSGWSGTFDGAVDHVTLGTSAGSTTYNFEPNAITAAVPEPSTYALMVLGLGAIGWSARRRRG